MLTVQRNYTRQIFLSHYSKIFQWRRYHDCKKGRMSNRTQCITVDSHFSVVHTFFFWEMVCCSFFWRHFPPVTRRSSPVFCYSSSDGSSSSRSGDFCSSSLTFYYSLFSFCSLRSFFCFFSTSVSFLVSFFFSFFFSL